MQLVIDPCGDIRCVYAENLDLSVFGMLIVRRGSHVEPNRNGDWNADLSPVNGPVLGPFERRSEALAAELAWLQANWLLTGRS